MNEPAISVRDLTFSYNGDPILADVSFEVKRGEVVGIIGPNGAGKTTLIRCLLGILPVSHGSVRLLGTPIAKFRDWKKVGYVKQRATAFAGTLPLTVLEYVELGNGTPADVTSALDAVGMTKYATRTLHTLSGGELQRVFIAKALVPHPELLVLDEPTVGVDPSAQTTFYDLLRTLHTSMGITIVLVSHDIDVVANEVTTVLCINRGVTYCGKPKEFVAGDYLKHVYGHDVRHIIHGH